MTALRDEGHWSRQQERGSTWLLALSVWLSRHCPRWLVRVVTRVVVGYFFLTSARARRNIRRYQQRLLAAMPEVCLPSRAPVWRQFLAFGVAIVDRFAVWQGRICYADLRVEDPDGLYDDIRRAASRSVPGQLMICSHVGNIEICRALVEHNRGFVLNILVHSRNAEKFNRALARAGASDIRLIQVSDLDLPLMMSLQQRLAAGEWLAIAADRTPVRGEKTVPVDFLGHEARLPQGPWLLADLLGAPINLVFCSWMDDRYRLRLERFSAAPGWSRRQRSAGVQAFAQRFADRLAEECRQVPLQWFNFHDFWQGASGNEQGAAPRAAGTGHASDDAR